jgi:DNA-directed RNA polymerase specialized sigma24 family protein
MIQKLNQRRNALAALSEQHLDELYDLIYQVFGQQDYSVALLEKAFRTARKRYRFDRLERYARLWILRITVECIQKSYNHFLSEQVHNYTPTLSPLSLEEKLCILLHDRLELSLTEIGALLQLQPGRVGRSIVYGREKWANALNISTQTDLPLTERIKLHTTFAPCDSEYKQVIQQPRALLQNLPKHTLQEVNKVVPLAELLALLAAPKQLRWRDLSWKSKLTVETIGFALVGAIVVLALPWVISRINVTAIFEGRLADIIQVHTEVAKEPEVETITADRLIASKDLNETESNLPEMKDEFSGIEFPSGDAYEAGSAPLAPSRQNAAVYRLIVQSASPKEMIPVMRQLFATKKIRERESSGRAMPGGVYFDALTTQGDYQHLLKAVQGLKQVGKTRTYGNTGSQNPNERARVIIWVQQI